jgi:hypothetical protein
MKTTLACDEPGCGKSFTKISRERAELAIRMHRARAHKQTISVPGQTKDRIDGPKPKRTCTRRAKPVRAVAVNFCPCCGTNIQQVALAVAVAGTIKL